jgi:hypothetical protein
MSAKYVTIFALTLLTCVAAASTSAEAPVPSVQGWYEYCSPSQASCLSDLDQIASAGFTLVINYAVLYNSTSAQVLAYASHANSLGLKIAWDLSDAAWYQKENPAGVSYFKKFAKGCGCSTRKEFVTYYVNLVKNNPVTWGYYIGDETDPRYAPVVNSYSRLVRRLDANPAHTRLFVILGDASLSTERNEIRAFLPQVDMIGEDYYPIGNPYTSIADMGTAAGNLQTIATENGKQSAVVNQAMSWADYPPGFCVPFPSCEPFPTYQQMLHMRNTMLRNSQPSILLWYSFFDLQKSSDPGANWANATAAAFAAE